MIALIRPVLFSLLNSDKVKILIIDLLTQLAKKTDNEVVELVLIFVCQRAVFSRDSFGRVYAVLLFATVRRSKADYRRF
jgi:hypothetical protein